MTTWTQKDEEALKEHKALAEQREARKAAADPLRVLADNIESGKCTIRHLVLEPIYPAFLSIGGPLGPIGQKLVAQFYFSGGEA